MTRFTALGLGEILWDVLPDKRMLGGAPANFAYHFSSLGGSGVPVSRIGDDELGREALDILQAHDISTEHISIDPTHPTGTVNASIDKNGVATYTFPDDVAWDFLAFADDTRQLAAQADAICFGTLAQRATTSRKALHGLLATATQALKIYDINLRQSFFGPQRILASLELADVLKINDEELAVAANLFALPSDQESALAALVEKHGLRLGVLTRGGKGSLLLSPDGRSELPGRPTTVVDTIGAGDSFTAAMALGLLRGMNLDEINEYATSVAAFVCGCAGAMPPMPKSLQLS